MPAAMSNLALQIIGLSEEEQAHIHAVTDRLATDPGFGQGLKPLSGQG